MPVSEHCCSCHRLLHLNRTSDWRACESCGALSCRRCESFGCLVCRDRQADRLVHMVLGPEDHHPEPLS